MQSIDLFKLFPNKPRFLHVCSTYKSFENTWGEEKLLVTSNFSSPHVFSTHLDNFFSFSSNLILSYANYFSLEESKMCCFGKGWIAKSLGPSQLARAAQVDMVLYFPQCRCAHLYVYMLCAIDHRGY